MSNEPKCPKCGNDHNVERIVKGICAEYLCNCGAHFGTASASEMTGKYGPRDIFSEFNDEEQSNDRAWREAAEWVRGVLETIVATDFERVETLKGACSVLSYALDPAKNPKLRGDDE